MERKKGIEEDLVLRGTTLRIYRFMYRRGEPMGLRELQRGAGLSSPSVAQYHLEKLLVAGLIKEEKGGYVVDRRLFKNMMKIRRTVIPFQTTYVIFFASTLVLLIAITRPSEMTSSYVLGLAINVVALGVSCYEALKTLKSFQS